MDISVIEFGRRYTLAVPSEGVDATGQEKIIALLRKAIGKHFDRNPEGVRIAWPDTWTWRWHQPNGKYAGNLPKRLQSFLYKEFDHTKLEPKEVTEIGNLAKKHSQEANEYYFDFTDNLEETLGKFGDEGTCFHLGDSHFNILQAVGVLAMRLYSGPTNNHKGVGRMWLYPWSGDPKDPQPADPLQPYALLGFNAYGLQQKDYEKQVWQADEGGNGAVRRYGQMQTLDYSRLLALHLGQSYAHIHLSAMGRHGNDGPMYFNNAGRSAVLVAPPEVVAQFKSKKEKDSDEFVPAKIDLPWSKAFLTKMMPTCSRCGHRIGKKASKYLRARTIVPGYEHLRYCQQCVEETFMPCVVCESKHPVNRMHRFILRGRYIYYCPEHTTIHAFTCAGCGKNEHLLQSRRILMRNPKSGRLQMGTFCPNCAEQRQPLLSCHSCGVTYQPVKGKDELYEKLPAGPLLVQCPRCKAKGKRLAAQEAAADEDEEIDPADYVFNPPEYDPNEPPRLRLYHFLELDSDRPREVDRENLRLSVDPLPENRAYPGQGWTYWRYYTGEGPELAIPLERWDELEVLAVQKAALGENLIYDPGEQGETVRYCAHNATALALWSGLAPEARGKRYYDPVLNLHCHFIHRSDEQELALAMSISDLTNNPTPSPEAAMGLFRLRHALLESPTLFAALTMWYNEENYRTVYAAYWHPDGTIYLKAADATTLLRVQCPELVHPIYKAAKEKQPDDGLKAVIFKARQAADQLGAVFVAGDAANIGRWVGAEELEPEIRRREVRAVEFRQMEPPLMAMPEIAPDFPAGMFARRQDGRIHHSNRNVGVMVDYMGIERENGTYYSPYRRTWGDAGVLQGDNELMLAGFTNPRAHPNRTRARNGHVQEGEFIERLGRNEITLLLATNEHAFRFVATYPLGAHLTEWSWEPQGGGDYYGKYTAIYMEQAVAEVFVGPNGNTRFNRL